MLNYIVEKDCLLTFLTHNDSYDLIVRKGEVISVKNNNVYYRDKLSISTIQFLLFHSFVKQVQ